MASIGSSTSSILHETPLEMESHEFTCPGGDSIFAVDWTSYDVTAATREPKLERKVFVKFITDRQVKGSTEHESRLYLQDKGWRLAFKGEASGEVQVHEATLLEFMNHVNGKGLDRVFNAIVNGEDVKGLENILQQQPINLNLPASENVWEPTHEHKVKVSRRGHGVKNVLTWIPGDIERCNARGHGDNDDSVYFSFANKINQKQLANSCSKSKKHGYCEQALLRNASTALHICAYTEEPEKAEVLLKYGADINTRDNDGYTPLMRAIEYRKPSTVSVFMKHEADLNIESADGNSALVLSTKHTQSKRLFHKLLKATSDEYIKNHSAQLLGELTTANNKKQEVLIWKSNAIINRLLSLSSSKHSGEIKHFLIRLLKNGQADLLKTVCQNNPTIASVFDRELFIELAINEPKLVPELLKMYAEQGGDLFDVMSTISTEHEKNILELAIKNVRDVNEAESLKYEIKHLLISYSKKTERALSRHKSPALSLPDSGVSSGDDSEDEENQITRIDSVSSLLDVDGPLNRGRHQVNESGETLEEEYSLVINPPEPEEPKFR